MNEPGCIEDGLHLIDMVGRSRVAGATVLELGSGWQPLIPLLFKEAGAERVILTDAARLTDENYFERARSLLEANGHAINCQFSEFDYRAPCNWATIPDGSVDIVWSRAVLEHIAPGMIATLFREFRRILKPNGVMAHIIDNSDHWEHQDKSISRVNFLKFGDTVWSIVNFHPLFYQNRLRHSDYLRLINEAGFAIVGSDAEVCSRSAAALDAIVLSTRFRTYDKKDLATITSRVVAKPAPASAVQAL